MSLETVKYEPGPGAVALITLNRPEALNALSRRLINDLTAAIELAVDDGARAVVLTGAGRGFCAGGDLREMGVALRSADTIEAIFDESIGALHRAIRLIRETPIPFVAAVNGVCAGAGTNFALACDIVIAADDAVFNEAFVKIGLTPDCGGSFFLTRAIGEKRAAEMFMTGETINAERALSIGMINRVVPLSELTAAAAQFARKLAEAPTGAIGRIKKLLNASFSNSLERQLDLERTCQIESGQSADFNEGVTAFFEKRPPKFTGN
jgi:2-(1,2-epoxy-1,2-dihydrophenyl)acetyl-CoA isomerase